MKYFIRPEEFINKDRRDIVVLDTRSREAIRENPVKIPGSKYLWFKDDLLDKVDGTVTEETKEIAKAIAQATDYLGMDHDDQIILYSGEHEFHRGTKSAIQLMYLGYKDVYVLEGGIEWYQGAGGETEPIKTLQPKLVDKDYVLRNLDHEDTIIVDARPVDQYEEGHIPGAINIQYVDPFMGVKIKEEEKLEEIFEPLKDYKEIIVYCNTGNAASILGLAMMEAGLEPSVYMNSMEEWAREGLPINV